MFESFEEGDEIAWWSDSHGKGVASDHPDARRRTGAVVGVYRHREDEARIAACIVLCTGLLGTYQVTIRPDYGHQPERI
jgi:hypothetical protein